MILRLILLCIAILSFSVGKAYCITPANSFHSDETPGDKAAVAKNSPTTAGKTQVAPNSLPASSKSGGTKSNAKTGGAKLNTAANMTKQHLLLESVDGNTLYTKDGNKVEIPSSVKIINNTRNGVAVNAELTYISGQLIEAMIR